MHYGVCVCVCVEENIMTLCNEIYSIVNVYIVAIQSSLINHMKMELVLDVSKTLSLQNIGTFLDG
jgi:hypothetical protein